MARRGRKGRGHHKAKTTSFPVKKQVPSATSISHVATPRVHPATNDCYPLNKLCRLCLLSNINMEPIFSYPGDDRLAQKIFQCTNLKIKENADDGIPTSLCGQCKKQLDQCYEFRLLCWKNDEILHNLHALLSPTRKPSHSQVVRSNPVVQLEKLNLSPSVLPTPFRREKSNVNRFDEIPLSQLYTPARRGHRAVKIHPQFSRELVVRLSPVPASLINKYKKASVTQTKAAVKSFAQSPNPRGRPKGTAKKIPPKPVVKRVVKPVVKRVVKPVVKRVAKPVVKRVVKPIAKPKAVPKAKPEKHKAKRAEIAVPPKKRKQNFEPAPTVTTATCVLCTQAFNSVKSLSRHMAAHENNRKNNRVFNCDVCKKEYLKASQLTDHLQSADHVNNATRNGANEEEISILPDESDAGVSILPDDADVSILPDEHSTTEVNISVESSENPEPEVEEITDSVAEEVERRQPSPDTNDNSQQNEPAEEDVVSDPNPEQEMNVQPEAEVNTNRDASPIPVDSESSRSLEGGVQYSDVCSTNNAENLLNGSGADPFNASRRVTFSDITEIVE